MDEIGFSLSRSFTHAKGYPSLILHLPRLPPFSGPAHAFAARPLPAAKPQLMDFSGSLLDFGGGALSIAVSTLGNISNTTGNHTNGTIIPPTNDPATDPNCGVTKCCLIGGFVSYAVQGSLGVLAMTSLLYKRHSERPVRHCRVRCACVCICGCGCG